MPWQALFLPEFAEDLRGFQKGGKPSQGEFEQAVRSEFEGLKGERVTKLFVQGVSTKQLDRLASSKYHGSIRMQIFQDYRVTAVCLPDYKAAIVSHLFHKSTDPNYRNAPTIHDARVKRYFDTFTGFLSRGRG